MPFWWTGHSVRSRDVACRLSQDCRKRSTVWLAYQTPNIVNSNSLIALTRWVHCARTSSVWQVIMTSSGKSNLTAQVCIILRNKALIPDRCFSVMLSEIRITVTEIESGTEHSLLCRVGQPVAETMRRALRLDRGSDVTVFIGETALIGSFADDDVEDGAKLAVKWCPSDDMVRKAFYENDLHTLCEMLKAGGNPDAISSSDTYTYPGGRLITVAKDGGDLDEALAEVQLMQMMQARYEREEIMCCRMLGKVNGRDDYVPSSLLHWDADGRLKMG